MIHWFGHDSFRFDGSKIIYSDPWDLKISEPKADIILVTHNHYDHCVPEDIAKVVKDGTVIVGTEDCLEKIKSFNVSVFQRSRFQIAISGESFTANGVNIEVVPAYNINKKFHPRSNNWVGYVFTLDGERIYQAGDTDAIPEMKNIKADIVIFPVGGTYTMTAEEAASVVNEIRPKLAIPMHWGKIVGTADDAERFKKLCKCEVKILRQE